MHLRKHRHASDQRREWYTFRLQSKGNKLRVWPRRICTSNERDNVETPCALWFGGSQLPQGPVAPLVNPSRWNDSPATVIYARPRSPLPERHLCARLARKVDTRSVNVKTSLRKQFPGDPLKADATVARSVLWESFGNIQVAPSATENRLKLGQWSEDEEGVDVGNARFDVWTWQNE